MEYLAEKGKRNLKFWAIRHAALQNLATSDMAVFPSQRAADLFLENNPQVRAALSGRARVAYSGIDDCLKTATVPQARVPPEVKGSLRIVSIGHHVPIKRIDVVLYALRSLLDKRPPVPAISFVNFGGETEHTRRLRELTAALGLEGTVQFRGLRPNSEVMAALVEADLFLVVPELAAFDLALLEAMAAAKPIITSRAGGNPEALGQAYPFYAETSEQVCASLERMIGGWQGAVAIGRQNRERFLRFFTIKAMVDRYWDLASEAADFPSRSGVAVGPR
jgi:glycosyltransferase involved in cell wall biosynthesis